MMRCSLIEYNLHSGRCEGALRRVVEDLLDVFDRDTWKRLNELGRGYTVFQVLEPRRDGARVPENTHTPLTTSEWRSAAVHDE